MAISLDEWERNARILLLATEMQDMVFRKSVCEKCSSEMRKKRKCEEEIAGRTFCRALVNARKKNRTLELLEIRQTLSSPFIKEFHGSGNFVYEALVLDSV